MLKTHSLMEWHASKFVVLKHFGSNCLHKESSAPFLFTIYMLKMYFVEIFLSVEHEFDRCVEI